MALPVSNDTSIHTCTDKYMCSDIKDPMTKQNAVKSYPFLLFNLSLNVRVHGNTSYGNAGANSSLCGNPVACSAWGLANVSYEYDKRKRNNCSFPREGETVHAPKIMIEKPMTKTRFNTLPTACVRGATRSKVFVATCNSMSPWYHWS